MWRIPSPSFLSFMTHMANGRLAGAEHTAALRVHLTIAVGAQASPCRRRAARFLGGAQQGAQGQGYLPPVHYHPPRPQNQYYSFLSHKHSPTSLQSAWAKPLTSIEWKPGIGGPQGAGAIYGCRSGMFVQELGAQAQEQADQVSASRLRVAPRAISGIHTWNSSTGSFHLVYMARV